MHFYWKHKTRMISEEQHSGNPLFRKTTIRYLIHDEEKSKSILSSLSLSLRNAPEHKQLPDQIPQCFKS
jgi:hypothetical protein